MINTSELDRETLSDLREVRINMDLPKEERILDFVRQIKNPYCYKIGKYVVCLRFSENGPPAQEVFSDLVRSKMGI